MDNESGNRRNCYVCGYWIMIASKEKKDIATCNSCNSVYEKTNADWEITKVGRQIVEPREQVCGPS